MCNPHGNIFSRFHSISLFTTHIDRSYTIYTHITVRRRSRWNGVYLDSTGVFPVDVRFTRRFSLLFFFSLSPFSPVPFSARLEKNHARGMHSRRANCARARRRFSRVRFFNANVTLTPASDDSVNNLSSGFFRLRVIVFFIRNVSRLRGVTFRTK